jgi:hypothetical protein
MPDRSWVCGKDVHSMETRPRTWREKRDSRGIDSTDTVLSLVPAKA